MVKKLEPYTIDPATGVITFQPNKDFVGTPDPAKVVAKDTNGTKVETTYTPTVTPVTPTADPAETTDIQVKNKTANQHLHQVNQTYQWMTKYQQPSKMDQQLRQFQAKEHTQ